MTSNFQAVFPLSGWSAGSAVAAAQVLEGYVAGSAAPGEGDVVRNGKGGWPCARQLIERHTGRLVGKAAGCPHGRASCWRLGRSAATRATKARRAVTIDVAADSTWRRCGRGEPRGWRRLPGTCGRALLPAWEAFNPLVEVGNLITGLQQVVSKGAVLAR